MLRFWESAASRFQSSTKSHTGASLKLHILRQPYIQRTALNMASAAESIQKKLARMIANLNEEIANLNEGTANLYKRIRVLKQKTRAMKEFINKEVLVQGNWPGGSSGRPVTANALGSSVVGAEEKTVSKGFKSDNSNMESKPEEMGGTGREEGGFKILKENIQVVKDEGVIRDQEKKEENKKEEVEQEETVRAHQFKFFGKIESMDVIVFVCQSATHNFISKELVNDLGIPLQRSPKRFRLNFGCGTGSEGAEVCEGVVLKTQGIEIVETFYVTDLAIADVVLGNEWLRSLGDRTLHLGKPMSLTFNWQGRTVKLEEYPSLPRRNEVEIMSLGWI